MNVTMKGKLFHNPHGDKMYYSIGDGSKNVDGTYTNKSWSIRFKGDAPTNESKIDIEGFFSYWKKDKDAPTYATIQCMEWAYVDEQPKQETKVEPTNKFNPFDSVKEEKNEDPFSSASSIEIGDDDLPF